MTPSRIRERGFKEQERQIREALTEEIIDRDLLVMGYSSQQNL